MRRFCPLFAVTLLTGWAIGPVTRAAEGDEDPGRTLERLGARVGKYALAVRPRSPGEMGQDQAKNKYAMVVIGADWKGGVEGLKYLEATPGVVGVMFCNKDFNDTWCRCLARMPALKELYLQGEKFTDEGMKHLRNLKKLEVLSLMLTKVSDEGLVHLEGIEGLRWLSLAGVTRVTDRGFVRLRLPEIRQLDLDSTSVTGDGIANLKHSPKMESLCLSGHLLLSEDGPMLNAGLQHLMGMSRLKQLGIGSMQASVEEMDALLSKAKELPGIRTSYGLYTRNGLQTEDAKEKKEKLDRLLKRIREIRELSKQ